MSFLRIESDLYFLGQMLDKKPESRGGLRGYTTAEDGCFLVRLYDDNGGHSDVVGISEESGKRFIDFEKTSWIIGSPEFRRRSCFRLEATKRAFNSLTVIEPFTFEPVNFATAVRRIQKGRYKEVRRRRQSEAHKLKRRLELQDERFEVLNFLWEERLDGHRWVYSSVMQEKLYGKHHRQPKRTMSFNRRLRLVINSLIEERLVAATNDSTFDYSAQILPAGFTKRAEWAEIRRLSERQNRHDSRVLYATIFAAIAAAASAAGTLMQANTVDKQTKLQEMEYHGSKSATSQPQIGDNR